MNAGDSSESRKEGLLDKLAPDPTVMGVRLRRLVARWARVLVLGLIGAVTFELILPIAWVYARRLTVIHSPVFLTLAIWLGTLMLFYVVIEPIRIRAGQWRRILWYPPLWLAVLLGWGLAAASERMSVQIRPQTIGPDWLHAYPLIPIALALAIALALRQTPWRPTTAKVVTQGPGVGQAIGWQEIGSWISAGERPIAGHERDFFRHRPVAARIAAIAGHEGRSVALLGRFGTGKTSILNMAREQLARLSPAVIVADFDVWAVPRPEDVPRLALNRIVAALDDYVDTIEFRTLPLAYQRLAAAEPTGRLSRALGLESGTDSLDELTRLTPILEAVNARLLLIVEDIERAGKGFDTRHLQRLLWALRRVNRSSFVLAVDPDYAPLDFGKLCDTIELVPPLDVRRVAEVLIVAHDHWSAQFSDIDPHPDRREGDKLRLSEARQSDLLEYIERTGKDTPLFALVALLQTPRSLKHVLRRVDDTWRRLHGEAELHDIIIVSALRHGAEPAYQFLIADIDAARHKPSDMLPRTKTVKEAWSQLVKTLQSADAVQRLVDLMGIEQLTTGHAWNVETAPQGVHVAEPVDYFRRIVAGELSPNELRDQSVLRDIEEWKAGTRNPLIDKLVAGSDEDVEYVARWEHLSFRHSEAELMELTEQVAASILSRDRSSAAADHPALLALWRRCNRRLLINQSVEWLRQLILRAVPVSLRFVNRLYYYWTGAHGIADGASRQSIRASVVEALQAANKTSDDLAGILPKDQHPYEIGRLITQTGSEATLAAFAEWRESLASLLIEGGRKDPDTFIPEIANLAGDTESSMVAAGGEYPPIFINRYRIKREQTEAFFGDSLDEALALLANYTGVDPYGVRAKDDAMTWLQERRAGSKT